jgi:NAD(P)-dependent dehydrogenase (short-subunit alcohol dehydrogenase family)
MTEKRRIAIVTGASRGLGNVVARVLAVRGYDLVIGAREKTALIQSSASLRQAGRRVVTVDGDIAEHAVRARLVDEARQLGGLDILVNNASVLGGIQPVIDLDLSLVDHVLAVNVVAPIALVQLAAPLLARTGGLIVNISSDAARGAYPGWGVYGASKAALELLTRTIDTELRERRIYSVAVDPGDMRTRMHQQAFPGEDISDRPDPEVTAPFWNWLLAQDPKTIGGERFAAQEDHERWLLPA